MQNKDWVFDITNVNVDVKLEKKERVREFLKYVDNEKYNKAIKINNTTVYFNFLSNEKLNSKSILKVLS